MIRRIAPALRAVIAAVVLSLPFAGGALAQDRERTQRERAEEMAREGMETILRSLELLMESIPQYELPEVNDKGDIIIRRKRPGGAEPEKRKTPPEEPDATDT